eukprot:CAMPEP_0115237970 /NCGR_PEP_ID=MMETSP0270-20121206/36635_1 /TAXON_ID=71861 /ORGANISM="Scrippsiella trochoidea, Strain CCMP3099" /LENGTH=461 /DNA_ID=CAMNT_0002652869 /DNA_START=120 /DNA_END=1505 /DNA_ORIENTATION=+
MTQLLLMSFVVFACPGMFNALNSIGLGGDPAMGRIVNTCLYGTWMLTSSFAPTVVNVMGAKWAMLFGTLGYPIYSLAMFYHRRVWAVLAGCLLGLSAGLLWTAQGQLMMSYPDKTRVARFVAIFWGIFNSGGVLGCLMAFFINIDDDAEGSKASGGVSLSAATYWMFFTIMCCGAALSMVLLPLNRVTRKTTGGQVECVLDAPAETGQTAETPSMDLLLREIRRTRRAFGNPVMLLLIPFMFYSNFFYEYHFGMIGALFNGRTGSLTAALYWIAQILGSFILQAFLDWDGWSLERRMRLSFVGIMTYVAATWTFGGYIQYSYTVSDTIQGLDINGQSKSPIAAMVCLCLWGFVDSFVQVWSYWMMSQLSDVPEELACFTAFYKLWQNAGAFCSFLLGLQRSYVLSFWVNIALIGLLIPPTSLAIIRARTGSAAAKEEKATACACDADTNSTSSTTENSEQP